MRLKTWKIQQVSFNEFLKKQFSDEQMNCNSFRYSPSDCAKINRYACLYGVVAAARVNLRMFQHPISKHCLLHQESITRRLKKEESKG